MKCGMIYNKNQILMKKLGQLIVGLSNSKKNCNSWLTGQECANLHTKNCHNFTCKSEKL